MIRWTLLVAAVCVAQAADLAPVNRYCTGCHSTKAKAGGLALDSTVSSDSWEKVVRRLRARSMPPAGLPRPDERAYDALIASLETQLDAAKPNPGRTDTFRRLNRTEYQNAIRDLLAIDVDVTSLLPGDESSHGFDNITVGNLSPTLLERYLAAARKISRLAVGIAPRSVGGDTFNLPPDLTQEDHFDELPAGTRGGTVVKYTFPVDGEYEFQVRLARDRNEHVEGLYAAHDIELTIDGERVRMFTVKPPAPGKDHNLVDKEMNVRVAVKAGPHVVGAAFPKQPSTLLETERQPYQAHFNMDRHPRITPAVYSVSINGPYESKGPGDTPSRRRIYVCKAETDACAAEIFSKVMRRAYRRPVQSADLRTPMRFFAESRKDGFDAGIEMGLRAVLVSPEFLFRVERDPAGGGRISDLELATRLSFFLWSSLPDDELLDAKLSDPAVLERQTRRMLADPRSRALVTNFAGQWLQLRNLASITPDMRLFPDFDDNLRRAFRKETELLVETVMREDRSVLELLSANYTFVNGRLAKHYGIPNIYGGRFRRVEVPGRGGLLRQGSILMVTSYATRTSPVIRGKWVLDNLLGTPPPPPPAVVPALPEKSKTNKPLSMRERLAEHRDNPACSGCHKLMDPVGFALENYDAIGRWREADAAGGLPDGSAFDGVTGLRAALLKRPELFAGAFSEKLLSYSLGRLVEPFDGPAVRKIVRDARAKDYRFSTFITGIVLSAPFTMRSSE